MHFASTDCRRVDEEDAEDEWEEVLLEASSRKEGNGAVTQPSAMGFPISQGSLEITLTREDVPGSSAKVFRRKITKQDRLRRHHVHKGHVLCLLAIAQHAHRAAFHSICRATSLSLVPSEVLDKCKVDYIERYRLDPLIRWLRSTLIADPWLPFPTDLENAPTKFTLKERLTHVLRTGQGHPASIRLVCASILWALGIPCRLVVALNPIKLTFQGEMQASSPLSGANSQESNSLRGRNAREVLVEAAPKEYPLAFALEIQRKSRFGDHYEWTPLDLSLASVVSFNGARSESPIHAPILHARPYDAFALSGFQEFSYVVALRPLNEISRKRRCPRVKDVSVRYLAHHPRKRLVEDPKLRVPLDDPWWARVCSHYDQGASESQHIVSSQPDPSGSDSPCAGSSQVEDQELLQRLLTSPFPTKLADYKSHRLFVLERHLKANEVIHPRQPILGKIKGEHIFSRTCVQSLLTLDGWIRQEGLQIKQDSKACKVQKVRGEERHLFGRWQTEPYQPEPVINGVVPKNRFGNVELFHPRMLPGGAAHLTFDNARKIAKELKIDFADAVVGFEHIRGGKTVPIINGIVVPQCAVEKIDDVRRDLQAQENANASEKKSQRALHNWVVFIQKLLNRDHISRIFANTAGQISGSPDRTKKRIVMHEDQVVKRRRSDGLEGSSPGSQMDVVSVNLRPRRALQAVPRLPVSRRSSRPSGSSESSDENNDVQHSDASESHSSKSRSYPRLRRRQPTYPLASLGRGVSDASDTSASEYADDAPESDEDFEFQGGGFL